MKVRIISSAAVLSGAQLRRGAMLELDDQTARVLIETNQAEAVEAPENPPPKADPPRRPRAASRTTPPDAE